MRELLVASPLGCVGTFMLGGAFSALFGMSAIYANQQGFSIAETSYFVTAIYMGGLIFQYPIGWLSDRMDRRILIVATAGACALACAAAMFADNSITGLVIAALFIGGTTNPLYSLLLAYTNDFLESDQMAAASGGMLFINGIGAMGGPIAIGYLMSKFGSLAFFVFIAILMLSIFFYGIYRMTQRAAIAVDETAPYIPITSRTTQVATEIAIEVSDDETTDGSRAN